MSSPEKPEVCDLRLSLVSVNSDVPPPEDAEPQECFPTETLCLRRAKLNCVSERVLENSTLKVSLDCPFVNL